MSEPYYDTRRLLDHPPFWDDLRFPAVAINPPGAASDPAVEAGSGTFLFAATGTELVYLQAQMPHAWAPATIIGPHLHWQKTTSAAGDVVWELAYKWAPINEVMDAAWTIDTVSSTVPGTPDTDTADKHLISSFGALAIDTTDKDISDMLLIRLSRLGSDASDTYGADARLLEFDIHYQIDGFGSDAEFIKTLYTAPTPL